MQKVISKKRFAFYISVLALLPTVSFAMQSTNYKINLDAIDVGGIYSSSLNYVDEDTIGESGTGISSSTNYILGAGYQQMFQTYLAISLPGNITMPTINGIGGGISTSSIALTVTTDDAAGYGMYIQASSSPALKTTSGSFFADYMPSGSPTPDFTWLISSSSSAFGFSPHGSDIVSLYRNNGSTCNTGSSNTLNTCWDGFSTTTKLISQALSSNQPLGTETDVSLEAQVGSNKIQDSGSYQATITMTVVAL